ncbi:MAG: hypothetical protein QRY71_01750 [Candidatus Rhabdochlamydia sp.]
MTTSINDTTQPSVQAPQPAFMLIADTLNQKVNHICQLWQDESNTISMQKELEGLYLEGVKLVTAEVQSAPLTYTVLTQIVTALNEKVNWANFESRYDIHTSLSKTYRIFLELVSHQSFFKAIEVSPTTKENLLARATENLKYIPQKRPSIRFEYECSLEAAKLLKISQGVLQNYGTTVASFAANTVAFTAFATATVAAPGPHAALLVNAAALTFSSAMNDIKTFVEKVDRNWARSWYSDVRKLRWEATAIRTLANFTQVINPIYKGFIDNGNQYTLGLAATYIDIIQNQAIDDDVKVEAAQSFLALGHLKDNNILDRYLNFKEKSLTNKPPLDEIKRFDKYFPTRLFVYEYIQKFRSHFSSLNVDVDQHQNPNQTHYTEDHEVVRQKKVGADAFADLISKYKDLKEYLNQTEQFIQETRDILTAEEQEERDREVELAKEDLKEARIEEVQYQNEILENLMAQLKLEEQAAREAMDALDQELT